MRCIICDEWSPHTIECDFCDNPVCDDCVVDGDFDAIFCSEECREETLLK